MLKYCQLYLIAAVLISGCVIPRYNEKVSIQDTKINQQQVCIHKVLIIGAGSTPTRLFLDNLSTKMTNWLSAKGIQSEYTYIGKIPREAHIKLEALENPNFDGYILFNPKDTSYFNNHKEKYDVIVPIPGEPGIVANVYGSQYKENLSVEVYSSKNDLNLVWAADLNIDFDIGTYAKYIRLVKMIVAQMNKNNIVFK